MVAKPLERRWHGPCSASPDVLRVALALMVLTACEPAAIRAAQPPSCGPRRGGHWDPRFVLPGVTGGHGDARSLVELPDGKLAVGGAFDRALGAPLHNVGTWDGTDWAPLGDGLPGAVLGLATDDAGALWAVGTASEDRATGYVARWDSVAWTMVATDVDGITGIVAVADGIVVFGQFATIEGVDAKGLAVWNGGWSARALDASWVTTVTRTAQGFCAGGRLASAASGLTLDDGAACWDGVSWSRLGDRISFPTALARGPDGRWWAGGNFAFLAPDGEHVLARGLATLGADLRWQPFEGGIHDWDSFFPSPMVNAISFEGEGILIAGRFIAVGAERLPAVGLARWTPATGWRAVAAGGAVTRRSTLNAVVADGSRLHVAGTFDGIGNTLATNVATIEPDDTVTAWTGARIALGPQALVSTLVDTPRGLLAAGSVLATGVNGPAAVFDGSWQSLPRVPDLTFTYASHAAALPSGALVLSGEFVWRSDGTAWTRLTDEPTDDSPLLVDGDGAVYLTQPSPTGTTIMRSDGGSPTTLGTIDDEEVVAMTIYDGALVMLARPRDDQRSRVFVRRDDGWDQILDAAGSPLELTVSPTHGLVVSSDRGLVAWDGTSWRTLTTASTTAIAACDDGLFAARWRYVDDRLVSELGFHDGVAWQWLAAEEPGAITALTPTAEGLYVGLVADGTPGVKLWTNAR